MSESIRCLIPIIEGEGIIPILVGGYALQEHGYVRNTYDYDFVIPASKKEALYRGMKRAGFSLGLEAEMVTRFIHRIPGIPVVDALWDR